MATTVTNSANGNAKANETIFELALPFLAMDDLFPNCCLVSKRYPQKCWKLLHDHCQEHHPTLILMEHTTNGNTRNGLSDSNTSENGANKRWLTYKRYRLFRNAEEHISFNGHSYLEDYEMILDISTSTTLLVHDIQPLRHSDLGCTGCTFGIDNFPCSGKDMRMGDIKDLELRVRVLMRRISSGEIVVIMNRTEPFDVEADEEADEEGDDVDDGNREAGIDCWYWYRSDDLISTHPQPAHFREFLFAYVRFNRHRASDGEIVFGTEWDRAHDEPVEIEFEIWKHDEPVENAFDFDNHLVHSTLGLLDAIDKWKWI